MSDFKMNPRNSAFAGSVVGRIEDIKGKDGLGHDDYEPNIGCREKIVSILLAICFVLPLSTCTPKKSEDATVSIESATLHGFDLAGQGWEHIRAAKSDGLLTLLVVLHVFFVPILCLGLKPRLQAVVYLFGSLAAEYFLTMWVVVFATHADPGDVIAMLCWALLFCIGVATLWRSRARI